MARPERRQRVSIEAFIMWVGVVFAVTVCAALELTGRGSLVAAFIGSLILSETVFAQEA
jgi:hypothetical protein